MAMTSKSVLVLLCGIGIVTVCGYPVIKRPPPSSWDTVGGKIFLHVTKPTAFNDTELDFLTKASIVQFDKSMNIQSMPDEPEESRFLAAAKQIKAKNPSTFTLMYQNGLIDFTNSTMNAVTSKDPDAYNLKNENGKSVTTVAPYKTFDMRKPSMVKLFVDDCVWAIGTGAFDGCFIDRANFALSVKSSFNGSIPSKGWDPEVVDSMIPAQLALLGNLTAAIGETHIVLAKDSDMPGAKDWTAANAVMPTDTFCSKYERSKEPYNADDCLADILATQAYASRGQLTECHGMGPMYNATQREYTLACFLVAAGDYSYFSYANWGAGAWSLAGTSWWPEYDRPLGTPLGLATRNGYVFKRSFSSGTNVTVDVQRHVADIRWAA